MFQTTHPHVGHLIRRSQQIHTMMWNAEVSDEVTSPQVMILVALARNPGVDQRTLGETVSLDRSTTADIIERLMKRGFLERARDPKDRRRNLLQLTADGINLLETVGPRSEAMNEHLISVLSAEDQAQLIRLLRQFVNAADLLFQDKSDTDEPDAAASTAG
jgi:DNA-binding MarR family transcriptional regulator